MEIYFQMENFIVMFLVDLLSYFYLRLLCKWGAMIRFRSYRLWENCLNFGQHNVSMNVFPYMNLGDIE